MALTTKFYSFSFTTSTYSASLSFSSAYNSIALSTAVDVSSSSLGYSSLGSYIIYTVPSGKTAKVYLNNFRGYYSGSASGPVSVSTGGSTAGGGNSFFYTHAIECYLAANANNIVFTDGGSIEDSRLNSLAATTSAGANTGVSFTGTISGTVFSDFWYRSFSLTPYANPMWDKSYIDLTFYMGPNQNLAMYYIVSGGTEATITTTNSQSAAPASVLWFANVSTTMAHTLSGQLLVIEEDASAPT